jgi:hypothetical protein
MHGTRNSNHSPVTLAVRRGMSTAGGGKGRRSVRKTRSRHGDGENGAGKRCRVDDVKDYGNGEIGAGKRRRFDEDYNDGETGAGNGTGD